MRKISVSIDIQPKKHILRKPFFSPMSPPLANRHVAQRTPEALRSLRDRIAGLGARLSPGIGLDVGKFNQLKW